MKYLYTKMEQLAEQFVKANGGAASVSQKKLTQFLLKNVYVYIDEPIGAISKPFDSLSFFMSLSEVVLNPKSNRAKLPYISVSVGKGKAIHKSGRGISISNFILLSDSGKPAYILINPMAKVKL